MSKTLLIIIGLSCAVITAAGIMWHLSNSPRNQVIKQYNKLLLDASGGRELSDIAREFRDDNNTIDDAIGMLLYSKPKESLPVIRELLKDRNPEVRASAINALAGIPDEESLPAIRKLLKDRNLKVRASAINALTSLHDEESLPAIRELIKDKNTAASAIWALAMTGDKESIPEIRKMLLIDDDQIRGTSIYALAWLGDKESAPEIREFLNDKNEWLRDGAINALVKLGDKESIPLLKELLKNEEIDAVFAATLEQFGVPYEEIAEIKWEGQATAADIVKLRQQLHNKNLSIQQNAMYWIIKLDDKESIPDIKKLLKDKDEEVRFYAESLLKELGVSEAEIEEAKEAK